MRLIARMADQQQVGATKESMGTGEIKGHLWKYILHKQLQVTEGYFNSKV